MAQLPGAPLPVSVPTVSLPAPPAPAPAAPAPAPSAPTVEAPAAPAPAPESPAVAAPVPVPEVTAPEPPGESPAPDPGAATPSDPAAALPEPALPDPVESVPAAPALPDTPSVDLPAPLPDLPAPQLPDPAIELPELPIDEPVAGALEPVTPVADEATGRVDREVDAATDLLAPVLGGGSDPPALEPPILVGDALEDLGPIDDVAGSLPPVLGGVAGSLPPALNDLLDSSLPLGGDSSGGLLPLAEVLDAGGSLVAPLIEPVRAPLAGLGPSLGQAGTTLPSLLPALPGGGGGSPPPAGPGALLDPPPSRPDRPRPSRGLAESSQATGAFPVAAPPADGVPAPEGLPAFLPAGEPALPLGFAAPRPLQDPRGAGGPAAPSQPFGWATHIPTPFGTVTGAAVFASALLDRSTTAPQLGGDAPGPPQAPAPAGAAAGPGGAGVASSTLFALLVSLAAFALRHSTRLQLAPARWRPQAFVAVLERPG